MDEGKGCRIRGDEVVIAASNDGVAAAEAVRPHWCRGHHPRPIR